MKFLLDHDVPEDLTCLLQELNHEVVRLRDVYYLKTQYEVDSLLRMLVRLRPSRSAGLD